MNGMDTVGNKEDEDASAEALPGGSAPWNDQQTWRRLFEQLPAPVYACDPAGRVIFFNAAAAALWGREPRIGHDLWCGSLHILRPDGSRLPLEQCPMALALRDQRAVRAMEMEIVIERPDGSRRRVMSHPQPVFTATGVFAGAFNLLLDITDYKEADELRGRLTAIIRSSDDAIISKSLDGIITSWNNGAERLFGYTAEEAVGRPVTMLIPEDRIDEEPEVLARIRRGETIDHYETIRRRKDGSMINISLTVSPMTNTQGQIVGASKIARDISERKDADHARNMLAAIVQSSDDAIISKDLKGIITSWNRGAQRLFGYTALEAVGRSITMLIPPERIKEEPHVLSRIVRGESIEHFETVRRHKSGALLDISLTVSPIINAQGKIIGASKIARDISERKRAEKALADADRRKDEFLATLAHELRNPLAPLRTSLEYLRQSGLSAAPPAQVIEIMGRQVDHMVRLIDDLLEISRISRGIIELKQETLCLSDAVNDAIEISRPMIEPRGHRLEISLAPDALQVHGDRVRLAQVFANLLNNAAKFTPPGGTIRLSLERQEGMAVARVSDTGNGIPQDKLEDIFEMFTQVRGSGQAASGGLGVGLSLVRRLLQMHSGTVQAHSAGPGLGSEFTVRLPLAVPVVQHLETPPSHPAKAGLDPDPATRAVPRRVLLVDDNRDAVEAMAMLLESLGHEVHVAYNGPDGLAQAEALRPEVVLLDIGMPGMSGYDVADALRLQPWGKSLRLIALTGWGQSSDRARTAEAGFDHHLVKPIDFDSLEQLLTAPPQQIVH
ncbi:PAS domain S-box protein [Nevskia soli]|uniref:PAS domain S-box protein n=1 Tax=Nevskia soli TaxID=418856 RepID=UPI0009FDFAC9|nr:PAS domain S-box protein [Nevskia soli]